METIKASRVLVVDGDEDSGDALAQMLTGFGHIAVSCSDPYQALNLFEDGPGRFDMVMIDQAIPQATGAELATLLLRIRDDVPMVLLMHEGEPIPHDQVVRAGFRTALTKPVSAEQVRDVVERIAEELREV